MEDGAASGLHLHLIDAPKNLLRSRTVCEEASLRGVTFPKDWRSLWTCDSNMKTYFRTRFLSLNVCDRHDFTFSVPISVHFGVSYSIDTDTQLILPGSIRLIKSPKNVPSMSFEGHEDRHILTCHAYKAKAFFPAEKPSNLAGTEWCDRHHPAEYHIEKSLCREVLRRFDESPEHPLTRRVAPVKKGVYGLYWKGEFVYGGRSRSKDGLRRRLDEHFRRIQNRRGIDVEDVSCRFLLVEEDLIVRAVEHIIIEHKEGVWQHSRFGSHGPEGESTRNTERLDWDLMFPRKAAGRQGTPQGE